MIIRKIIISFAFTVLFFLNCHTIPPPTTEPGEPREPVKIIARDDFNGSSQYFNRGSNAGNMSAINAGQYELAGNSSEAAWIFSQAYGHDSLVAIRASVSVSDDFYIGLSTTINSGSAKSIFDEPSRLLFYVYRKPDGTYAFHVKFKTEYDPATAIVPTQKCYLSFKFNQSDSSISMLYSNDGQSYSEIAKDKVDASWHSVYFAISAWHTPLHGVASIDWAELEYWSKPDTTITPPVYRKATLQWNRNKEPDMLGYNVYIQSKNINEKFFIQDTTVDFQNLSTEQYKFFVTALDSAHNESIPSDTVSF